MPSNNTAIRLPLSFLSTRNVFRYQPMPPGKCPLLPLNFGSKFCEMLQSCGNCTSCHPASDTCMPAFARSSAFRMNFQSKSKFSFSLTRSWAAAMHGQTTANASIHRLHNLFFIIRFQVFHDSRSKVRKIPSKGLYRMLPIFALKKLFKAPCYMRKNIRYTKEKDATCAKVFAIGAKMQQAENM